MEISLFSLAVTIVGAYIGAGFVSGQELWQFFGSFGIMGLFGFALAIMIICILSGATLVFVAKTGRNTFDKVVCTNNSKLLRMSVIIFQFVFYIGIYVIMCAGAQSLIIEYTDINKLIVGIIYCLTVTFISLIGSKGITTFFSAVIPILVLSTAIIAILTIFKNGITLPMKEQTHSLLSNWLVSSFVFVSYNYFAGIGVFALVGKFIKSRRKTILSSILAFVFLLILGFSIIISISTSGTQKYDMPMLNTAYGINPIASTLYAILLLLAMLGAGISSMIPFVELFNKNSPQNKRVTFISAIAISCIALILSLFGFSNLIGTIYPVFGYLGAVITLFVVGNFLREKGR